MEAPYYALFWRMGAGACGIVAIIAAAVTAVAELNISADARDWRAGGARTDKNGVNRTQAYSREWIRAQRVREGLAAGRMPQAIAPHDPAPQPGEAFFVDTRAVCSRYTAAVDSSATGTPAFVSAGLIVTGTYRRQRTWLEAQYVRFWRRPASVRVVASDRRIAVHAGKKWLSFPYAAMTAIHPEVGEATLVCEFAATPPLLLRGAAIPTVALLTVHQTTGADAVRTHPALGVLDE
ncbi:hypothetical protein [Microbacterium sp. SLBN-111]|uniref:hypothetical protein n=1 Tax=Microbacterium sp. SLBN-111 TaxID=3377733 RepID=UPI003C77B197